MRSSGPWRAGVELSKDLVDELAGDSESFGDFGDWSALIADGFDDGKVAVRSCSFVNDVATDLSPSGTLLQERRVNYVMTSSPVSHPKGEIDTPCAVPLREDPHRVFALT